MLLLSALLVCAGGGLLQVSADDLAAPSISLTPEHPLYITGESLQITCSASGDYTPSGFQYFKQEEVILQVSEVYQNSYSYLLSNVDVRSAGSYSCAYWITHQRHMYTSKLSRRVILIITDVPPAPSISLIPRYPVYVRGESVTVTCSAPGGSRVSGFLYYKEWKGLISKTISSQSRDSHVISTSDPEAAGSYSCAYWIETSGRQIQSRGSDKEPLSVTDVPPAPSISLIPRYPVYVRGESVTVTCSAPGGSRVNGFLYYKEWKGLISKTISSQSRDSHVISTSDPEAAGSYSCAYWIETSGRQIQSRGSDKEPLSVTEHPPAPSISLTPPHTVYVRGESVTVICSAPAGYTPGGFRYFKKAKGESKEVTSQGNDAQEISTADPKAAGSYSCVYWIQKIGREIHSRRSGEQSISVTDRPPAPSISLTPPHSVYVRGESVTVICSAPAGYTARRFRYFKKAEGNFTEVTSQGNDPQEISTADPEAAGSYSCAYWIQTSGREIQSRGSDEQSISVTDPLPAPMLYLYPEGRLTEGENLTLNCSVPSYQNLTFYQKLTFHFLREEDTTGSGSPGVGETSVQISVPVILGNHSQNRLYSCYYEAVIHGRTLRSNGSVQFQVTVVRDTDSPSVLLYWYYVAGGGAALQLILILLICCTKKGGTPLVSSSSKEDYTYAKTVMPAPKPEPVARNEHVYTEIDAVEPSPALYSVVKVPCPAPTYSTVNASQPPPPYFTLGLPSSAPTYSTVGLPPSAPGYSTVGLPSVLTYSTVGLLPSAPTYETVDTP